MTIDEKPDIQYSDIGGMDMQKQEIREAVELPLTHFELYKQIGIDPPRGVLMYGPPGCGKTMLAKAVAHHTTGNYLYIFIVPYGFSCTQWKIDLKTPFHRMIVVQAYYLMNILCNIYSDVLQIFF